MLSWNPDVTGKVGHYIEIYNPNPWETFGGMGSKKLVGPNIDYIANNDSHPGAQFDPQFRDLVKSEVAKLVDQDRQDPQDQQDRHDAGVVTARADTAKPVDVAAAQPPGRVAVNQMAVQGQIIDLPRHSAAKDQVKDRENDRVATADAPAPVEVADNSPAPAMAPELEAAGEAAPPAQAETPPQSAADQAAGLARQPDELTAFLDTLTGTVDSGDLSAAGQPAERQLTHSDMMDYAKRAYGASHAAAFAPGGQRAPKSGMITTASVAFDRP
jgi:hypothetical protein